MDSNAIRQMVREAISLCYLAAAPASVLDSVDRRGVVESESVAVRFIAFALGAMYPAPYDRAASAEWRRMFLAVRDAIDSVPTREWDASVSDADIDAVIRALPEPRPIG